MPALIPIVFGGLLPLASAWSLGGIFTRGLKLPSPIRFAAGTAVLSIVLFFILLSGNLNRLTLTVLAATTFAIGNRSLAVAALFRSRETFWRRAELRSLRPSWIWLIVVPYALLYLVHALAPEIQPDGTTYHLGLVREWVRTGGFSGRVTHYEMFPQLAESLFAMAYAFGGASAAKLVHFAFLAAAVPLLIAIGKELGMNAGPAAIIYCITPVVGITATAAYNDAALAFFVLGAFYLLLIAARDPRPQIALLAGLLAGSCYAVKLTGFVVVPAVVCYLFLKYGWRRAGLGLAAAALAIAPWMLRAEIMSQNPVAPWLNKWFPNPYFHIDTENRLQEKLRNYELTPADLPLEVTLRGSRTSGLLGPLFLLLPIGLLALRRRSGQIVWLAAAIAAAPWLFNAGTRFLIPAIPFFALALVMAIPKQFVWVMVGAHAVLSWPLVLSAYADPHAWSLRGFPWQAALRLESERDYLKQNLFEYSVAELVQAHTKPADRILDLFGAPNAYFDALAVAPWQSAEADRAYDSIEIASVLDRGTLYNLQSTWPARNLAAIRFRQLESAPAEWSIQEVTLFNGAERIVPSRAWKLYADPNQWETPFAFDRNTASRWRTWQPRQSGMYFEMDFPAPQPTTGATLICFRAEHAENVAIEGRSSPGTAWVTLPKPGVLPHESLNYRQEAGRFLDRQGFHFILTPVGNDGAGFIGRELVEHARDWGLQILGHAGPVYLLRGSGTRSSALVSGQ